MSDPSSNLKNNVRGWQARKMKKSKSESVSVDDTVDGFTVIEGADIRDGKQQLYNTIKLTWL